MESIWWIVIIIVLVLVAVICATAVAWTLRPRQGLLQPLIHTGGSDYIDSIKRCILEDKRSPADCLKEHGAANVTLTHYVGPWNSISAAYRFKNPPTSEVDAAAMEHDMEYADIAMKYLDGKYTLTDAEEYGKQSDEKLLYRLEQHKSKDRWAATLARIGIGSSRYFKELGILDHLAFIAEKPDADGRNNYLYTPNAAELHKKAAIVEKLALIEFADDCMSLEKEKEWASVADAYAEGRTPSPSAASPSAASPSAASPSAASPSAAPGLLARWFPSIFGDAEAERSPLIQRDQLRL